MPRSLYVLPAAMLAVLALWALAYGRLPAGGDPVTTPVAGYETQQHYTHVHTLLTPSFQLCGRLVQQLFPDSMDRALHYINLLALGAACILAAVAFGRNSKERLVLAAACLAALCSGHALNALRIATLHGMAVFLFTASLALCARRKLQVLAGLGFALSFSYCPYLALTLAPALVLRRWLLLAGTLLGALALFAISPDNWIDYFGRHGLTGWTYYRAEENISPAVFWAWLGGAGPGMPVAAGAWVLAFAHLFVAAAGLSYLFFLAGAGPLNDDTQLPAALALAVPVVLCVPASAHPLLAATLLPLLPVLAAAWTGLDGEKTRSARLALLAAVLGMGLAVLPGIPSGQEFGAYFTLAACGMTLTAASAAAWQFTRMRQALALDPSVWTPSGRLAAFLFRQKDKPVLPALAGSACMALALWFYGTFGFHALVAGGWVAALACWFMALDRPSACLAALPHPNRKDRRALLVLLLACLPVYLWNGYGIPVQVATDELSFTSYERTLMDQGRVDFLGLAGDYFCWPSGCFVFLGACTKLLGGTTLANVRLVNGALGVLAVLAVYLFARLKLPRPAALACAVIFGACHPFVTISRMALRDTIPVLLQTVALGLLYVGLTRGRRGLVFVGGVVAGLGVYNYYSGRIAVVIGVGYLLTLAVFRGRRTGSQRQGLPVTRLMATAGVCLLGFGLCAAPMLLATWETGEAAVRYSREQTVLTPEGRRINLEWTKASSEAAALLDNAVRGLTAFNNNRPDGSAAYVNAGHGFVDPLTGVLVWIGVLAVLLRRKRAFDFLVLMGFVLTWGVVGILSNKNPAYCRMLVVLPFAAFLAAQGAWWLSFGLKRCFKRLGRRPHGQPTAGAARATRAAVLGCLAAAVTLLNGWILYDHYRQGVDPGDTVGATVRYVAAQAAAPVRVIYFVTGEDFPYYWFGGDFWTVWLWEFKGPAQSIEILRSAAQARPSSGPSNRACC